jgi:hypothetical protein
MREHFAVYLWKPAGYGIHRRAPRGPCVFYFFFPLFLRLFLFYVREMNSGGEKSSGEENRRYVPWHDDRAKACPTRYREDATGRFRRA